MSETGHRSLSPCLVSLWSWRRKTKTRSGERNDEGGNGEISNLSVIYILCKRGLFISLYIDHRAKKKPTVSVYFVFLFFVPLYILVVLYSSFLSIGLYTTRRQHTKSLRYIRASSLYLYIKSIIGSFWLLDLNEFVLQSPALQHRSRKTKSRTLYQIVPLCTDGTLMSNLYAGLASI
jgi:hypothetical protein